MPEELDGEVGRAQQYCKTKPTHDKVGASSCTSSPSKTEFNIEGDSWSPYFEINSITYSGIMGKQKILMGDMPEVLLRQILGNTIYIQEV